MAFKNLSYLILLISLYLSLSLSKPNNHRHQTTLPPTPAPTPSPLPTPFSTTQLPPSQTLGQWALLQKTIGISAMHMQLLYNNRLIIFDRTNFGLSNLSLPSDTKCRYNDELKNIDCTAHSVSYDTALNTFRPLSVQTDFWCSSASVLPDGTLLQTGGYLTGANKIRSFTPCDDEKCDWIEFERNLTVQRWYATNQILPDGRIIIVGGRRAFSYEFFPKNQEDGTLKNVFNLSFLLQTSDSKEENNLYPFVHILPDGNLFIFANQRSILFDYSNHRVLKEYPVIPDAKRSYPSTGSSVLLPFKLVSGEVLPEAEVMICGGSYGGAYLKARVGHYVAASTSCGRLKVSDPDPKWVMEEMPMGRVMPDMLLVPTGDVVIINGAGRGTGGWENADDPVLYPVLYSSNVDDPKKRFTVMNPTTIPRMYHSAAALLPDGRILVGGSNPHVRYNFTDVKFPTELSLESFSPPYLAADLRYLQPSIISVEYPSDYGQQFSVMFSLGPDIRNGEINVVMIAPSFTTHSFAMNQRLLVLDSSDVQQLSDVAYKASVFAPPSRNVAPPGYYMLFVVHEGVPSHCVWIKMNL
ncbi:aldehyde oxidase GLOX [Heracleum sosnowskyi]|uniref:Aldehyde oxidase GLOX n=1 Tax=Heracleum sosnowskyi TaxID=360622 RepID=A0AAD8M7A2_9APIA|nr:aldehyde oxidase GLOX [Heracleum sosnowskyi]